MTTSHRTLGKSGESDTSIARNVASQIRFLDGLLLLLLLVVEQFPVISSVKVIVLLRRDNTNRVVMKLAHVRPNAGAKCGMLLPPPPPPTPAFARSDMMEVT